MSGPADQACESYSTSSCEVASGKRYSLWGLSPSVYTNGESHPLFAAIPLLPGKAQDQAKAAYPDSAESRSEANRPRARASSCWAHARNFKHDTEAAGRSVYCIRKNIKENQQTPPY